jgi:Grx4 family monothiol glutaredoxin
LGLCEELSVESVPSFIFVESRSGKVLDRVEGANPALFSSLVSKYSEYKGTTGSNSIINASSQSPSSSLDNINARLDSLINTCPVMLFMKGSPGSPKCGFSRQIVQILHDRKVSFGYFDILNDQVVREELKRYSDWATYPQLYIKGELVGGLDIVKEAIESGDFDEMLLNKDAFLKDRLEKLINKDELMIFIKGSPNTPKCGFTQQLLELLQGHK